MKVIAFTSLKKFLIAFAFWITIEIASASSGKFGKPNFIIILTDDQGWGDFSANVTNENLKTPHLDDLVKSGANFSSGYTSAPQCIPARVGLLLGRTQNKIRIERNSDSLEPFLKERNLAELLTENGYACTIIGKWHLGQINETPNHGFRFFSIKFALPPSGLISQKKVLYLALRKWELSHIISMVVRKLL